MNTLLVTILVLLFTSIFLFLRKKKKSPRVYFATYGKKHVIAQSVLDSHEIGTIGQLFYERVKIKPDAPAFYEKEGKEWKVSTWATLFEQSSKVANYLVNELHLPRSSKICILGPTKAKWVIADMGVMLAGCVSVGIYPNQTYQQYEFIIGNSESSVVFVDGKEELERIIQATKGLTCVKAIVVWDDVLAKEIHDARVVGWSTTQREKMSDKEIKERIKRETVDDLAILVYTSGTTGPPKGVMLTHTNILSLARNIMHSSKMYEDDLSFNFLPLSHVAERCLGLYARIDKGVTNCFASSIGQVIFELQEVSPTVFGAVPRIFEKAYAKVFSDVAQKPQIVQRIFNWALRVADQHNQLIFSKKAIPLDLEIKNKIAKFIFSPVRQAFGGRVRQMLVGAAPVDKKLLEFFWGCGIPLYEVYGLTEVTVLCFANNPSTFKLGTVGKALRGAECKLAEDGEILIRAPYVFLGYYNDPKATEEVKDKDGWLHTGDIGTLDDEGFLTITDRKKHLIITSGGKNLSPTNIEMAIRTPDPIISQVHAHGDKRNFIVCIVTPSPLETLEFALKEKLISIEEHDKMVKELINDPFHRSSELNRISAKVTSLPLFIDRVSKAVEAGNKKLSQVEKVKKYFILDRDFSQELGELTPTMKMKRREIEKKFKGTFDKMYEDEAFGFSVPFA